MIFQSFFLPICIEVAISRVKTADIVLSL